MPTETDLHSRLSQRHIPGLDGMRAVAVFLVIYRDVVGFALEPVLIAVLLVQLIALSAAGLWRWIAGLWRWIEWPVLRFLGRISYSLYLYQQLTLFSIRKRLEGQPVVVQLLLAVLGTTVVASLSYYVIEQPFLKLKRERDPAAHLDPVNA
jgi:peptidoglycan/LPS O-acetylase OafA/YrhL